MRVFREAVAVGLLLGGAADARAAGTDAQSLEYEVKAAYLFNLVNASEWPSAAFASPSSPLRVCVAEPNPFGRLLSQTFQNEHVGTHPVEVTTANAPRDVAACHVLFVSDGADDNGALMKAASAAPVLTVGQNRSFGRRGGIITFILDEGRVRFDVNQQAAARSGIRLSSKVLRVARQIS